MLNDLLLLSGNDIPFVEAQISIHQPTIKEIGYIGEEAFFIGCELLNFSKELLNVEDKTSLEDKSNFEIFMSIMRERNSALIQNKISAQMVLTLIFPEYHIKFNNDELLLIKEGEEPHSINAKNFEQFKQILVDMFCLNQRNSEGQNYNPAGGRAAEIAAKLAKGRAKAAAAKGETQKISVLSRYVSILAIGQQKDMNSLLKYTVYQLFDEFERFQLKVDYDLYVQGKLAGAKDMKEVEHWMKEIHS